MSDMQEWKDLEDMVKRVAEKEPMPESLAPKEIEKKLREALAKEEAGENKSDKFHGKGRIWKKRAPVWVSAIAACLVLVLVLSATLGQNSSSSEKGIKKAASNRPEMDGKVVLEDLEEKLFGSSSEDEIFEQIDRIQNPEKYMSIGERILYGFESLLGTARNTFGAKSKMDGMKNETAEDAASPSKDAVLEYTEQDISGEQKETGDGYSKTNLQELGVGEADVVITDGSYFYIRRANKHEIVIVQADGGQMGTVSQITWPDGDEKEEQYVHEFYVSGDKLVLMKTVLSYYASEEGKVRDSCKEETWTEIYDISDRHSPKQISVLKQDGSYESSRMTGGYLYVFSDHYVYDNIQKDVPESYMPCADGEVIACEDIYVPEEVNSSQYKVLTSVGLDAPESFQTEKAVLCGSSWCYVSPNAIYFLAESYEKETEDGYNLSEIWKFSYQSGNITGSATGTVKGAIRDQFAMSEANGYFRVVTTYGKHSNMYSQKRSGAIMEMEDAVFVSGEDRKNGLYVLDENLNLVGSLENMAENEQIYSARFFENTAYFVTFRQTDPLFSVDLSDPANPTLLGELKIPGFSEYLHPYGEGRLLGIGYEANASGRQTGIKLSMFDISDPSNVKEIATKVIAEFNDKASYSSPAMYNHKAVLVDLEKNLIGCNLQGYIYTDRTEAQNNAYMVYGYDDEQGFFLKKKTELTISCPNDASYYSAEYKAYEKELEKCSEIRGAYIGKYFYTINEGYNIQCFDMENDFALLGEYEY